MNEEQERAYEQGEKAAYARVLSVCVDGLQQDGNGERWRVERAAIVAALRGLCEEFGDNDWSDDLHLGDVIEKHLARHLRDA